MSTEILLGEPAFERIGLPYAQSLQRLGIDARIRTVDAAQFQKRMDDLDFDMAVALIPESESSATSRPISGPAARPTSRARRTSPGSATRWSTPWSRIW